MGIYYSINDKFIKTSKESKLSNYKYNEFVSALSDLQLKTKKTYGDEYKVIYTENISNGIENIGCFKYSVVDEIKIERNSVGEVKIHNYTFKILCQINPNINIQLKSECYKSFNIELCKKEIMGLKTQVTSSKLYTDAIEIHKLK